MFFQTSALTFSLPAFSSVLFFAESKTSWSLVSFAILDKLNKVIRNVDYNFDKYELGEAAKTLYNFVWNDFASWYVEISKVDLQSDDEANKINTKNVLIYTLKAIIKMLHPFCPFITEELYQALPHAEESISISEWPKVNEAFDDEQASLAFDDLCEVITSIRNERAKANKAPSKPIDITISCKDEDALSKLQAAWISFIEIKSEFGHSNGLETILPSK